MKNTFTRQYVVTVYDGLDRPEKQIYTDKLSEDGKTIHTYRQDGTLCLIKEFDSKGQYVMVKYDNSGTKEDYRVIGGRPDEGTELLFQKGILSRKKPLSMKCCQCVVKNNQKS